MTLINFMHYIYFGDNEDGYYNLSYQETTGYLKWTPDEAAEKKKQKRMITIKGLLQRQQQRPVEPLPLDLYRSHQKRGTDPSSNKVGFRETVW
mmetsp:Transcript_3795/g.5542  ORF Transcript_3795/g.5542 Transcript_3795/m.5542 type:complete len:93 (+) Transcript_3795:58-336(+)